MLVGFLFQANLMYDLMYIPRVRYVGTCCSVKVTFSLAATKPKLHPIIFSCHSTSPVSPPDGLKERLTLEPPDVIWLSVLIGVSNVVPKAAWAVVVSRLDQLQPPLV